MGSVPQLTQAKVARVGLIDSTLVWCGVPIRRFLIQILYDFDVDNSDQNALTVIVTNQDQKRLADTSVLLFLAPPPDGIRGSRQILRGFDRVSLAASSSESVVFSLTEADFSLPDEKGTFNLVEGIWIATLQAQMVMRLEALLSHSFI